PWCGRALADRQELRHAAAAAPPRRTAAPRAPAAWRARWGPTGARAATGGARLGQRSAVSRGRGAPRRELGRASAAGERCGGAARRAELRSFARVELIGELVNLRPSRARVYFELRDSTGAIPCAAWREDWEAIVALAGSPAGWPHEGGRSPEGMQVVIAGGCD